MTGVIPDSFSELESLERLWLQDNHLAGEVPAGLVMLDELRVFDVSHNEKLNGNIPEKGLGRLRELISLNLAKVGR